MRKMLTSDAKEAAPPFLKSINEAKNILLMTNQDWNGDNVAAFFGLHHFLLLQKKKSCPIAFKSIPKELQFQIPGHFQKELSVIEYSAFAEQIKQNQKKGVLPYDLSALDLIITIGSIPANNKEFIFPDSIPHLFVAYNAFAPAYPNYYLTYPITLSEMIYHLYIISQKPLNAEVGYALYSGIMAATYGFKAEKTSAETHEIIAHLLQQTNINPDLVHQNLFEKRPLRELYLFQKIALTTELHLNNQAVSILCTHEQLADAKSSQADLHPLLDFPFISKQVQIVIMVTESSRNHYCHLQLLAKKPLDSLAILDEWNPLGDSTEAEAILPFDMVDAKNLLLKRIQKLLL